MTRRQQDISWTDSLPVAMASGRKPKGKRKRRVVHADTEKHYASGMDEAEWQAYYYGSLSDNHGPVQRKPYAASAAQLGLKPGNWIPIVLWAAVVLLGLTILNRVRRGLAEIGDDEGTPD